MGIKTVFKKRIMLSKVIRRHIQTMKAAWAMNNALQRNAFTAGTITEMEGFKDYCRDLKQAGYIIVDDLRQKRIKKMMCGLTNEGLTEVEKFIDFMKKGQLQHDDTSRSEPADTVSNDSG